MSAPPSPHPLGRLVPLWGLLGVLLVIVVPLFRLAPIAGDAMRAGLGVGEWIALGLWVVFMAYSEGYKGFQNAFSPRVVARARGLLDERRVLPRALAPLTCMGLVYAPRWLLTIAWSVVIGISVLVVLVRQLDQPWRGIIDAGVVVGLGWGVLAILWFAVQALRGRPIVVPMDAKKGRNSTQFGI